MTIGEQFSGYTPKTFICDDLIIQIERYISFISPFKVFNF